MRNTLLAFCLLILILGISTFAGTEPKLIPLPQEYDLNNSYFKHKTLKVIGASDLKLQRQNFIKVLKKERFNFSDKKGGKITLIKEAVKNPLGIAGAYKLKVEPMAIEVRANDAAGFFYAAQTLRQLLTAKGIVCGEISDWPSYEIRGFMHDIGRNFLPMDVLKQQVEMMALYKMNTFHLHLTDYPGYRLESKKYPILNAKATGEKNRQPGEFYKVAEMREFLKFCRDRHVMVIPEVDMPGHSAYFNRAFKTDMQSDKGVAILKDLIAEVATIFPAEDCPYLHIGSDEVRIYRKNFMQDMTQLIRSHGYKVIYWRPGGSVVDDKVVTQLWTGSAQPHGNNPYIDSRATYINHMDPLAGIVRLFFMQPCRHDGTKKTNGLGGILASWADNTIDAKKGKWGIYDISPIYPAMVTWSENLWRGRRDSKLPYFVAKIPSKDSEYFKEFEAFEKRLLYHRNRFFKKKHFPYLKQTQQEWKLLGPIDAKTSADLEKSLLLEDAPSYSVNDSAIQWRQDKKPIGSTVHLQHFFGFEAHLDREKRGVVYAQTYVYSSKSQKVQWWIQFGTPSSSGRRNSANPQLGQWNHYGANIWINGKEVAPPQWQNPGSLGSQKASYKIPFTMEAYFYRKPTEVRLKKGWNRILLRVPGSSNRKSKWMFTCTPLKQSGLNIREVPELKFSATK